jgi:hypothetical protein
VKTEDHAVAAGHSVNPARWQEAFEGLMSRIAGRFTRVESRRRARKLVLGLLSDLPRKNCWTIAEWAGDRTPDGMQHLLGRAKWDADQVRDDVSDYVVEHLHDDEAVLVVDETGDVKKGTNTVGVQRQYTGTAGRIENAQVAVLRLGRHRPHRPPAREPAVADPPQPQHRRTRVLPLLLAGRSAADHLGARRWIKVAGRDRPPLAPVKLRCFLMVAILACGWVRVRAGPSGRGYRSPAGVPCARVAAASAHRRLR